MYSQPLAQVCIICRQKNDDSVLRQLRCIEDLTKGQKDGNNEDSRKIAMSLIMSTHNSCSYGLYCSKMRSMETQANDKARCIAPKVAEFIKNADRGQLQELLRLMQGYFPAAYRTCERIWHESHN